MIQKIKNLVLVSMAGFALLVSGLMMPIAAHAGISESVCTGSEAASQEPGCGKNNSAEIGTGLTDLAEDITNWFSIIVGAISVIMIIYGGFRYITSGGDSGKVGSAKNTIIYAIIGLIIVVLAQVIINVVISQTSKSGSSF